MGIDILAQGRIRPIKLVRAKAGNILYPTGSPNPGAQTRNYSKAKEKKTQMSFSTTQKSINKPGVP